MYVVEQLAQGRFLINNSYYLKNFSPVQYDI